MVVGHRIEWSTGRHVKVFRFRRWTFGLTN